MTTFFDPDEVIEVDFTESRTKRAQARVACFLHLRDLLYLHPRAASADTIALVQKLEAAVIAEKVAREKRLSVVRERAQQKAAIEQAKAESEIRFQEAFGARVFRQGKSRTVLEVKSPDIPTAIYEARLRGYDRAKPAKERKGEG